MNTLHPQLAESIEATLCNSLDEGVKRVVRDLVAAGVSVREIGAFVRRNNPDAPLTASAVEAWAGRCWEERGAL